MTASLKKLACTAACVLCALLLLAVSAEDVHAQGVATANLTGTITDSSGAALVGAKVVATNEGTGISESAAADAAGRYKIPDLLIGTYDVQATLSGFQTVIHKGIVLAVGANPVVDFSLPVGQISQTVNVEGNVSQVQTQTAAVSTLVSPEQLQNLPLNGRNFEQLISLAPGVSVVPQVTSGLLTSGWYGNENNYSVSGSRPVGEAFLLDNTDVSDFFNHGTGSAVAGTSLGVDAIAEFQILTNTYSAQFGGTGAAVNEVSKGGTNDYHGEAYEFLRNNDLDARNYFDYVEDPSTATLQPGAAPAFRRNQFGGNLGGPVKKDKLFFFVNYEGFRQALGSTGIAGVPEPYVLNGQLPCSVLSGPAPGVPFTGCPASTSGAPGSGGNPIVTAGFTSNTAIANQLKAILGLYPQPVAGAEDLGGYAQDPIVSGENTSENYFLGRVDYNLSSTDSFFGRYLMDRVNQENPTAGSVIPLWGDLEITRNQYFTMEEKHIFSSNILNLARFSYVRTHSGAVTTGETPPLDLFPGSGRQDADVGPGGGLSGVGASGLDPFRAIQNKTTVGDDVIWSHGAHSIKFGASLERVQTNIYQPFVYGGDFAFASLQSYMQGQAIGYLGSAPPTPDFKIQRYFRQNDFFPYIQDDWKLSPKLTLNLGLRWDFATNAVGAGGVPLEAIPNPLTDTGFILTHHVFATNPNWANLDPRLGIAYDPFADHKTSIRAGFGIFHEQTEARTYGVNYLLSPPSGAVLDFPPTPIPFPTIPNVPFSQFLGVSYKGTNHAPYVIQYNLNVQREIFSHTVLSVGFVGSQGVHLFSIHDENLPVPCSDHPAVLPAGVTCPATTSGIPGLAGNPFTGLLTNPNFGSLNDATPTSHSSYNSLQVAANRQFTHNFQAQVSYTWSKCLDDGSVTSAGEQGAYGVVDPYDQALDRGPCTFNRTQNLVINGLYSLPFTGNRLVSGWQLSEILSASTGLPVNVMDGFDQADTEGIEGPRPNYATGVPGCSPYQILNKVSQPAGSLPVVQYFNTACYTVEAQGTEGNLGRDSIYGPRLLNLDFSIIKRTKITEKLNTEFRAEFFNIINHTNFAQPTPGLYLGDFGGFVIPSPTAGQITALDSNPRQIQFAVKLLF
ncbi:MAG: TonB-dependent receptor [Candidatus Acidiferrales bacterium]